MTKKNNALRAALMIAAFAGTVGLSACNTMRGMGQDASSVGHDVSRGANSAQSAIVKHTGASAN